MITAEERERVKKDLPRTRIFTTQDSFLGNARRSFRGASRPFLRAVLWSCCGRVAREEEEECRKELRRADSWDLTEVFKEERNLAAGDEVFCGGDEWVGKVGF